MNKLLRLVAVTGAAIAMTGCAALQDRISLAHAPAQNVTPIKGTQGKKANVTVNAARADQAGVVSVRRNSKGRALSAIEVAAPVATTIEQAFESELAARGFVIDPRAPEVSIQADVSKFWNEFKPGLLAGDAIADLHMTVRVENRKRQLIYDRTVIARGMEKNIQFTTGGNAKLALENALSEALNMIFNDDQFIAALATEKVQIIRSSLTNVGQSK